MTFEPDDRAANIATLVAFVAPSRGVSFEDSTRATKKGFTQKVNLIPRNRIMELQH
ncbi:MAG: hypothetical protein HY895_21350 [Deltaproteobacteria bacterium]|nr:hypothetical protein [Deltaproteobacteria bacterium]